MNSRKTIAVISRTACLVLVPWVALGACGSSDNESPGAPAAAAGSAGAASAGTSPGGGGGRGGESAGGTSPRGGQGNAGENGGLSGSGGSSGQESTAGSGGNGGNGGNGGSNDEGAAGAGSLDDCFEGLRAAVGSFQDAEKTSADTTYRMRLALETGDRFGTSGSKPWLPIRLGLQTPDETLCITDEALLAASYTGSHHNCDDVLTFTQGDREYTITTPDSMIDYVDPTIYVRPSMLSISEGGDAIVGPLRLDTTECHASDDLEGVCRSGGPC